MSDNDACPLCGYEINNVYCMHSRRDYIAEIDRMKAALETARNEYELMRTEILARIEERDEAMKDRDKARRWARKFYRLYLIERENYLGISADEDIWF